MRVSFNGNICLRPNTYSIKYQNGGNTGTTSSNTAGDIIINTDKVTYVTNQPNTKTTELHMLNGDIITANSPFNLNMFNIAQQLKEDQTLHYDSDGKISIENNSVDKLNEALKSQALLNTNSVFTPFSAQNTDKVQEQTPQAAEPQKSNVNNEVNTNKQSGLTNTYNFKGIDYNVVGIHGFDSLDDLLKYISDKGMTNRGKSGNEWPGKCHNFSCEYGDIILGTSKIDINSDKAAALAAKGTDRQFQNVTCGSRATALELMKDELEAGRPCVVKITKTGENHFGLVCGIRKDADMNNLQSTDFLYIDSYDGKLGQLNGNGFRRLDNWKNGIHVWKGKDFNFSYSDKNQYAKKYKSPEEVKASYGIA